MVPDQIFFKVSNLFFEQTKSVLCSKGLDPNPMYLIQDQTTIKLSCTYKLKGTKTYIFLGFGGKTKPQETFVTNIKHKKINLLLKVSNR